MEGVTVSQQKSGRSPEVFSGLVNGSSYRLPQFDRISLMQAGKPAIGIRLRVNLDHDSCGS
jgi:hypothetical protein